MTDQEDPARNRIDEANGSGETETYGPAYQRLRETLRELIGETDAEEVDREAGARTRRRRGYVEPERAGVLRQSDSSDQSAVAREGAGDAHYGPEGERDSDDRPALSGEQAPSEAERRAGRRARRGRAASAIGGRSPAHHSFATAAARRWRICRMIPNLATKKPAAHRKNRHIHRGLSHRRCGGAMRRHHRPATLVRSLAAVA